MKDENIQIKVDPNHPETTRAILRLLSGLGYEGGLFFSTQFSILTQAGWFYLRNGRVDGWNRLGYISDHNDHRTIDTTKPKPKAKIIAPDGTEIELSDETWESIREAVK